MAQKGVQAFKKYTVQPTGIWATFSRIFQIDSNRSTGVPLNPLYRNPPPGSNDPKAFDDPVTTPAADLADNPYWKRDVRRSYPQLSVVNQGDVVGLLTVGSESAPKEDVLQIGDAGAKQLVELKDEGEKGLATYFKKDNKSIAGVLAPNGLPPMPHGLAPNEPKGGKAYQITKEQSYGDQYPCRNFG